MKRLLRNVVIVCALSPAAVTLAQASPASFTEAIAPFQITDNIYYVGSKDLAAYLIKTHAGDILINANLTSSPPQILASLRTLKIEPRDIKILLISHAHYDHDGGAVEIIKATGAQYMVMDADVPHVQSGGATDFSNELERNPASRLYPIARIDRVLHDGDEVTLGGVTLTAHKTPGHTQGCTTWTLRSPVNGTMKDVVIVGSWNVNAGYRLVDKPGIPASYPGIAKDFQHTFEVMDRLSCDVFLGAHGVYFQMLEKLQRSQAGAGLTAWIDPIGYREKLKERQKAFEAELERQQSGT